jgi:hypothetical protein
MADYELTEAEFNRVLIETQLKSCDILLRSFERLSYELEPEHLPGLLTARSVLRETISDLNKKLQ